MKKGSTWFLRLAVIVIGLLALLFGIFIVPSLGSEIILSWPQLSYLHYPIMIIFYTAGIPFFIALYQALKLLHYIDSNSAFSDSSITALRCIKNCAVIMGILFIINIPVTFFPIAQIDDAPGLIIMGAVIAAMPFTIAVFSAVLERLLKDAITMKSENELTV